ncbi:DNA-3-methyladenine glycosylase I [Desulfarculales bacterium]
MDQQPPRCAWVGNGLLYQAYHDQEWGVPVYDDRLLFKLLILDTGGSPSRPLLAHHPPVGGVPAAVPVPQVERKRVDSQNP